MSRNWWNRLLSPKPKTFEKSRTRLNVERLEDRCQPAVTGFRPIDAVGNNIANPELGIAGENLLRLSPEAYRVGTGDPNGFFTPSMNGGAPFFVAGSRLVSNIVNDQATVLFGTTDINTVNANNLSAFGYTFGQFLDHDMSLTPDTPVNDFPIPVDPLHDGLPTVGVPGPEVLDPIASLRMGRSQFDPTTGITGPREQLNVNTSYLDLSQVYGSTAAVAASLRTGTGGLLKSSHGLDGIIGTQDDLLPFNNLTYFTAAEIAGLNMANDVHLVASTELFAAGDVRANETTELTALQTLFMRNHNLIAKQLAQQSPSKFGFTTWTDQNLYDEARKLNIAQYQKIVYEQYLPALLGPNALTSYTGYKANVDPSISNEFSTVAFRFGHSLLNNHVPRHANDGTSVGDLSLAASFFNPRLLTPGFANSTDIGAVLKGDADINAQANDVMAVSSIRNLLFGQSGFGEDLMARDMWRAHDHGIGTYNQLRVAFGLAPITDTNILLTDPTDGFQFVSHGFEQITSDMHVARLLSDAYTGVTREAFLANGKFAGDIDPFTAGLAEDHVPGSDMGPLFQAILVDQFTRLRDGDRFFYLNDTFNAEEKKVLKTGETLGKIITANTGVTNLQTNVFKFEASVTGKVYLAPVEQAQGGPTLSGITVELLDAITGDVIATTVTNNKGEYTFNISATGSYKLRLELPPEQEQRDDPTVTISVSGTTIKKVDIGVLEIDDPLPPPM